MILDILQRRSGFLITICLFTFYLTPTFPTLPSLFILPYPLNTTLFLSSLQLVPYFSNFFFSSYFLFWYILLSSQRFVDSFGYVNIFPLLLKTLPLDSEKLSFLLNQLQDESVRIIIISMVILIAYVVVLSEIGSWAGYSYAPMYR